MTARLRPRRIVGGGFTLGALVSLACSMPNPEFDELRDEVGGTAEGNEEPSTGDGDPNTSGVPSTGDGDGDPMTTGDGDGDPTTTGDGDGDPMTTGDGDPTTTGDGDGDPPSCAGAEELCDGACVDTQTSYEHCGGCGNSCEGATVCGLGDCLPKRYVFVSTHLFPGDFGGAAVATEKCSDLAAVAGIPGSYRAWLSDDEQVPAQTWALTPGALVLRGGTIVAYSWQDFIDGELEAPINRDEFGDYVASPSIDECQIEHAVWTGTTNEGYPGESSCSTWSAQNAEGLVGDALSTDGWSDSGCTAYCQAMLPVYCVQE